MDEGSACNATHPYYWVELVDAGAPDAEHVHDPVEWLHRLGELVCVEEALEQLRRSRLSILGHLLDQERIDYTRSILAANSIFACS